RRQIARRRRRHEPKLVVVRCDFVAVVVDAVRIAAGVAPGTDADAQARARCARSRVQTLRDLFASGFGPSSACTRAAPTVSTSSMSLDEIPWTRRVGETGSGEIRRRGALALFCSWLRHRVRSPRADQGGLAAGS